MNFFISDIIFKLEKIQWREWGEMRNGSVLEVGESVKIVLSRYDKGNANSSIIYVIQI